MGLGETGSRAQPMRALQLWEAAWTHGVRVGPDSPVSPHSAISGWVGLWPILTRGNPRVIAGKSLPPQHSVPGGPAPSSTKSACQAPPPGHPTRL